MTDQPEPAQSPSSRVRRKKVAQFVVVFVVCVLTLLTSYRYAIPTTANDWYLFQVARHTSWILNLAGHSSAVENPERVKEDPALVRARIQAWRRGKEAPDTAPPAGEPARPLTRFEAWQYRALKLRRENPSRDRTTGPFVSFILKPGFPFLIREATRRLKAVEDDTALDERARAQRRTELAAALQQLKEQREAARRGEDAPWALRDIAFPFTVVPDCGAIPSISIFFSAVLAFPTRWRKRLIGILTGVPILYIVNCFRLSCLAVVGAWDYGAGYGGKWFRFSHEYVWQGIYIVFVVAVWMIWVEYVVRESEKCESQAESDG